MPAHGKGVQDMELWLCAAPSWPENGALGKDRRPHNLDAAGMVKQAEETDTVHRRYRLGWPRLPFDCDER